MPMADPPPHKRTNTQPVSQPGTGDQQILQWLQWAQQAQLQGQTTTAPPGWEAPPGFAAPPQHAPPQPQSDRYVVFLRESHPPLSLVVLVPEEHVGLLIGHSGNSVQEIRQRSGASVTIAPSAYTGDGADQAKPERAVTISGSPEQIQTAKVRVCVGAGNLLPQVLIQERLDQHETEAAAAARADILLEDRYVGAIIGRGGQGIREMEERSGARIRVAQERYSTNGERTVTVTGSKAGVEMAQQLMQERLNQAATEGGGRSRQSQQQQPCGGGGGGGSSGAGTLAAGNYGPPPPRGTGDLIERRMQVAGNQAGIIIGRGGVTIKELRERSGARISLSVAPPNDRSAPREVTISGSEAQIALAEQMINDMLQGGPQPALGQAIPPPMPAAMPATMPGMYAQQGPRVPPVPAAGAGFGTYGAVPPPGS